MNNKLFPPGLVILVKKDYGHWMFFLLALLLAAVLTNVISSGLLHYFGIDDISGYAFILKMVFFLICIFITGYFAFLLETTLKDSKFKMRFDQIVLFDDYLIGEIRTRRGSIEEKLKFTDIQHFIQEANDYVSLTLKDDFSPTGLIEVDYNRKQDYKMNRKLTKIQKKELVSFLNDQIKNHSEIKQV
jgi:hypothetical protein